MEKKETHTGVNALSIMAWTLSSKLTIEDIVSMLHSNSTISSSIWKNALSRKMIQWIDSCVKNVNMHTEFCKQFPKLSSKLPETYGCTTNGHWVEYYTLPNYANLRSLFEWISSLFSLNNTTLSSRIHIELGKSLLSKEHIVCATCQGVHPIDEHWDTLNECDYCHRKKSSYALQKKLFHNICHSVMFGKGTCDRFDGKHYSISTSSLSSSSSSTSASSLVNTLSFLDNEERKIEGASNTASPVLTPLPGSLGV